MDFTVGEAVIRVVADERVMGEDSARLAADLLKQAVAGGKRPVMWMMAAPSGFAFYSAFVELAAHDDELQAILRETQFFQFDDYPVGRGDDRWPITFRHLLEEHFFGPLERAVGSLGAVHLLELTGGAHDDAVIRAYEAALQDVLLDDQLFVLEIKGTGMDGHWGFHGSETPLDAQPGLMCVQMNELNVQQQMIDWPQYFRSVEMVPSEAVTANVALFMQADAIIDLTPQRGKAFAVLACYGRSEPSQLVPSSQLKRHPNAVSFLTEQAAWALIAYRQQVVAAGGVDVPLERSLVDALSSIWDNPENRELEVNNREKMGSILSTIFKNQPG